MEAIDQQILGNALDYLQSAAEHLARDDRRSFKYSVLHLQAGIELLLKARLAKEHWSLIFTDANDASKNALGSGIFQSTTFKSTCKRLENIANIKISTEHREQLQQLQNTRNILQHLHAEMSKETASSYLYSSTSFALEFIGTNYQEAETKFFGEIVKLRRSLSDAKDFVTHRMEQITGILVKAKLVESCICCPTRAFVIGDGNPHCLFCGFQTSPEIASAFVSTNLGGILGKCRLCDGPTVFVVDYIAQVLFGRPLGQLTCYKCGHRVNDTPTKIQFGVSHADADNSPPG